jgi:putative DNA primase/helicase
MTLSVNLDSIPIELKSLNRWAVWKPEIKEGRETKVSYYTQKRYANVSNPKTYLSFKDAEKLLSRYTEFEGLTFILTGDLGIIGVDYDDALGDSAKLAELRALNSYVEISPSGQGFRAFCFAKLLNDKGRHSTKHNVELYSTSKFLSVTGNHVEGTPCTVNEAQKPIDALYQKYFSFQNNVTDDSILPKTPITLSDKDIIQLLENGSYSGPFLDLYYKGKFDSSHSDADWELCKLLIFYTQDPEQVDRLFRESQLMRPKWGEIHGEGTYGEITINKCLLTRKSAYMGGSYIGKSLLISEYPYRVTEQGIYKTIQTKGPGGDTVENVQEICSTPCTITAVGRNLDTTMLLYKLLLKDPEGIEKEVWKDPTELLQKNGILQLQKEGLLFTESNTRDLADFFKTVIHKRIKTLPKEYVASKNGWKNDFSLFVVGNRAITADGEAAVLQRDNPTAELYTQKGKLSNWVRVAKVLLDYDSVRFKLYSACVPPLLKLLNMPSFVETQQVKSGNLKTTTGWLAASLWGDPERLQINSASTAVGIIKTVEFCTDLPIFVDETSITDSIKDLVYLIANGVGRSKGNSDGGLVMPTTWSTVLLTTGEKPILPESALTGQQVRVVPLREGVNKKLRPEVVNDIQTTIKPNYGHIGVLFLKELFKEKDNLTTLFNEYFKVLPEVEDITSDRAKGYYAAIALAGYLLEKVFVEIGIEAKNPYSVCEHYFTENVISNCFVPDHIKALSAAYSWFSANEVYFRGEDEGYPLNHERYGWVREDKKHGECICFNPDKLKKHLNTEIGPNTYEASVDEWKNAGILIPKMQTNKGTGAITKLKSNEISFKEHKVPVIKIPFEQFRINLNLEDSEEKKDNPDREKTTAANIKNTKFDIMNLAEQEGHKKVTTAFGVVIAVNDDTEAAEMMKLEGL